MSLKFNLSFNFQPFAFGPDLYIVRELSGTERDGYLTAMRKKVDLATTTGRTVVKDHTGLNSLLLSYAAEKIVGIEGAVELPPTLEALEAYIESEGITYDKLTLEKVTHADTQKWPTGMVSALNPIAQELSGLNPEAKKD